MTISDASGEAFTCSAGREADFGGRWTKPCDQERTANLHVLVTQLGEFTFCQEHMEELIASGLITDPYVSADGAELLVEQERNELRRIN